MRSRERGRSHTRDYGLTIFIDNLVEGVTKKEISDIFGEYGRIWDVYLSRKKRRNSNQFFGFVRFEREEDGVRAIRKTNTMLLHGFKLFVKKARFVKEQAKSNVTTRGVKRHHNRGERDVERKDSRFIDGHHRETNYAYSTRREREVQRDRSLAGTPQQEKMKTIRGIVSEENLEWLNRSLIAETSEPTEVGHLVIKLMNEWSSLVKIRDLGRFKFILTFDSKDDMEEAFTSGRDLLAVHFAEVNRWSQHERCITRRTWLEVFGIPPQAWCKDNLKAIGEIWGDVVLFDRDSERAQSMESAKILLDTCCLYPIEERICFTVGDLGFDLFIREIGSPFGATRLVQNSSKSTPSMEVPGFSCGVSLSEKANNDNEVAGVVGPTPCHSPTTSTSRVKSQFSNQEVVKSANVANSNSNGLVLSNANEMPWDGIGIWGKENAFIAQGGVGDNGVNIAGNFGEGGGDSASSKTNFAPVQYNEIEEGLVLDLWARRNKCSRGPLNDFDHQLEEGANMGFQCDEIVAQSFSSGPLEPPGFATIRDDGDCSTYSEKLPSVGNMVKLVEGVKGDVSPKSVDGKRKSNRCKKKISRSDDVCSDEEDINEEEEALKTWEVGKAVGLVCHDENVAISTIRSIRRSKRLEKKRRARGV